MKNIFPKFALKQLSTYVALIVIFVYNNLLDRKMECACADKSQADDCIFYILLPSLILFGLHLGMDKTIWRIFTYKCLSKKCDKCCMSLCCEIGFRFLKSVFVGLLWIVSLLVDGDWYVCCNNIKIRSHLACKDPKDITDGEREHIAELKSYSRNVGFGLLLAIVCVFVFTSCEWRRCCGDTSDCCNTRFLYEELILEEEENVLREILTKAARENLTKEIQDKIQNSEQWRKCYDAAANVIKNQTSPNITQGGSSINPSIINPSSRSKPNIPVISIQPGDIIAPVCPGSAQGPSPSSTCLQDPNILKGDSDAVTKDGDNSSKQPDVNRDDQNKRSGETSKDETELQKLVPKVKSVSESADDPGTSSIVTMSKL